MRVPEKIREILERLIEDLKSRESVVGIGLFGSWSRGDAVSSSDVDLLVLDARDFEYQYVERAELDNCFLDFNYIPEKWVQKSIPPEIDQKLYETQVLYDRNRTLTNAKDLVLKMYWEPERVDIRTENYLMEAEAYLSRARSSYNRDDLQSTKVNAAIGIETIMKVLIEINKMPISNSRFIAALEGSAKNLGLYKLYEDYLWVAGFSKLDKQRIGNLFNSFSALWRRTVNFTVENSSALKTLHVKVKNNLNYYGRESFLRGMSIRTRSLIEDGLFTEAAHYMFRTSVDMLENFAWLTSVMEGTRFDYASLLQQLKSSRTSPKEVYEKAVDTLGVREVSNREAEESLDKVKETILSVRKKKRDLIASLSES